MGMEDTIELHGPVEVRPYHKGDVQEGAPWREAFDEQALETGFAATASETITLEGRIIAIMSMIKQNSHVAGVNMVVNDRVRDCPKAFSEAVLGALEFYSVRDQLTKVYTLVREDNDMYKMWIERLGFVKEYIMKNAGEEHQDMIGYAYIPTVLGTDHRRL